MSGGWEELERPAPDRVILGTHELRPGSRVTLHPRPGGDVLDLALAGRAAVIEAIEQNIEGEITLAVVVEDDPGRDLGSMRQPGHRFFFSVSEVEPLDRGDGDRNEGPRILVAGIGNVFLGDDGFGVALADRLSRRKLPRSVEVVDFGIRGMDLAFAMQDGYDAVVLLDTTPRGQQPGTLFAIELEEDEQGEVSLEGHGMDPVKVMALVRALGGQAPPTYLIGCEPLTVPDTEDDEIVAVLSEPVRCALDHAVRLTESLLADIVEKTNEREVTPR